MATPPRSDRRRESSCVAVGQCAYLRLDRRKIVRQYGKTFLPVEQVGQSRRQGGMDADGALDRVREFRRMGGCHCDSWDAMTWRIGARRSDADRGVRIGDVAAGGVQPSDLLFSACVVE